MNHIYVLDFTPGERTRTNPPIIPLPLSFCRRGHFPVSTATKPPLKNKVHRQYKRQLIVVHFSYALVSKGYLKGKLQPGNNLHIFIPRLQHHDFTSICFTPSKSSRIDILKLLRNGPFEHVFRVLIS